MWRSEVKCLYKGIVEEELKQVIEDSFIKILLRRLADQNDKLGF